jgi:hypothetical protein
VKQRLYKKLMNLKNSTDKNDIPVLTSIFPDGGPESGGQQVTIVGENLGFSSNDLVNVTIIGVPCINISWHSSKNISCITGYKSGAGKGDVAVITVYGTSVPDQIHYQYFYAPQISSIFPDGGPISGNTWVSLYGRHFGEAQEDIVSVSMAGTLCKKWNWINGKQIDCLTNPEKKLTSLSGTVEIITLSGGKGKTDIILWTYNPTPFVANINYPFGPQDGGRHVILYGNSFGRNESDILSVSLAGVECHNFTYMDNSTISCITGAYLGSENGLTGPAIVKSKSNGDGDLFHRIPNANYTYTPRQILSDFSPMSSLSTLPARVTIFGTNLQYVPRTHIDSENGIYIGDVYCSDVFHSGPDIIRFQTPTLDRFYEGPIIIKSSLGGTVVSSKYFRFEPDCRIYTNSSKCDENMCFWCSSTTTCVSSIKSCPAFCLFHQTTEDCSIQPFCSWCFSTNNCLDRKIECPTSCFLLNTEEKCSSSLGVSDDCEWCSSTKSCLEGTATISSFCPKNCSLHLGVNFSCGSVVLLVLLVLLFFVIILGFWILIYFVRRDEKFANSLKRFGNNIYSRPWFKKKQDSLEESTFFGGVRASLNASNNWTKRSLSTVGRKVSKKENIDIDKEPLLSASTNDFPHTSYLSAIVSKSTTSRNHM